MAFLVSKFQQLPIILLTRRPSLKTELGRGGLLKNSEEDLPPQGNVPREIGAVTLSRQVLLREAEVFAVPLAAELALRDRNDPRLVRGCARVVQQTRLYP